MSEKTNEHSERVGSAVPEHTYDENRCIVSPTDIKELDGLQGNVSPFLSIVVPEIQKFVSSEMCIYSSEPKEQEAYLVNNYVKRTLSRMAAQWTKHRCFQQPLIRLFNNDEWKDIADDIESLNAYLSACKGKFFEKRLDFVSDCLKKSLKMRKAFGNEFLTFRVTTVSGGFDCWIHFKDKHSIKLLNAMVE